MTLRQKLSLGLMMPVTLALVALLAAALAQPVPDISPSSAEAQFDSSRALADAARLAHDYPDRVVGSPENALARAWIITRFAELGLKVETLPFTVTVASRARRGVLVWATVPGESEEVILVSAHYDTSPATNATSNDNSAGVATLLELARLFAGEQPRHTLIFLACDSNAYGPAWGAKNFAERFQDRIVAALDLAYPPGVVRSIRIEDTGLRSGFAPLWLQQAGLASLSRIGSFAVEADSLQGYLRRALPVSIGDYAAYLRARVPAIGLSAVTAPTVRGNGASPSAQDLGAYGRIAETWLRTVDALNPIPQASTYNFDLRLNGGRYLPGWAAAGLQLLLFAPLFLATAMAWQADRPSTDELKPEFFALLGLVVAGLDGYAVAYSLVVLGALPRYEMFPASPGDPFLLRPDWLAALAIFGTVALFGWFTFRRGGWGRFADMLDIPYRRTTLLLTLSATVFFFWQINGFAVSLFLGLPAYLWPWIEPRRAAWGKAFNVGLALAGALPFALGLYRLATSLPIGPWWWFLTLGAAYGLFPLPAVVAFVLSLGLLVRFLRHGLRDR